MSTGLTPNTREEMYLSAAAGETSTSDLPTPATRKEIYLNAIANNGGGGGGGTSDYSQLSNKPKINNVELDGNKSLADIGAQPTIDSSHKLSADNVDDTSATNKFATAAELEQIETNKNNILLKANTADVNSSINSLQAQIDNIVTPVTQDAEVQNARVGADGTRYVTLKSRLDTENNKINTTFIVDLSKNRYNPSTKTAGEYLKGDGTGTISNGAYFTSDFCNIAGFEAVTIQKFEGTTGVVTCRAYEFYNASKEFISGASSISITPNNITVPLNAKLMRFSGDSGAENYMLFEGTENVGSFIPYSEKYNFANYKGKTLVVNGDSIPFGYKENGNVGEPYPNQLAAYYGLNLLNYSIGGSTIAEWGSAGDMPQDRYPIVDRYQNMSDGDVVVIAGGTNDWHYGWCPLGTMDDRGKTTFYGALHVLCMGLLDKYSGKQIVFCTPIKRRKNNAQPTPDATNPYGKTLKEFCNAIKEVCDYYSIPVLDLYSESMINPHLDNQMNAYIEDGVHPNQAGHDIIARRVIGYFNQLIN